MPVPVNIVYPIDGGNYPLVDPAPAPPVNSAYITASFSSTCGGGPHQVTWGFDGNTLGKAEFYDQFSAQFVWKLPGGRHRFWVQSSCGQDSVDFNIG